MSITLPIDIYELLKLRLEDTLLAVVVEQMPEGSKFSSGRDTGEQSWVFRPHEMSSVMLELAEVHEVGAISLRMTAILQHQEGAVTSLYLEPVMQTGGVTDQGGMPVHAPVEAASDVKITSYIVEHVPEGMVFSPATYHGAGIWSIRPEDAAKVALRPQGKKLLDDIMTLTVFYESRGRPDVAKGSLHALNEAWIDSKTLAEGRFPLNLSVVAARLMQGIPD